MAQMDDEDAPLPLEGFGSVESRFASLEDRVTQLIWMTAHADPAAAPRAARPVYPHVQHREDMRRARMNRLENQLVPGGD